MLLRCRRLMPLLLSSGGGGGGGGGGDGSGGWPAGRASSSPLPLLPPPATAAAAAAGLLPSSPYLHTPVPLSLHPLPTRRLPTPSLPSHLFPAHSPNRCPSIQPPGGGGGGAPRDGWLGCSVAASAAAGDAARLIWAPARAGPKLPPAHAARRWPGGTSPEAKSPQQASAQ
jgi:hypothetical protein